MIPQRYKKRIPLALVLTAVVLFFLVSDYSPFTVTLSPSNNVKVSEGSSCNFVEPSKASIKCEDANTVTTVITLQGEGHQRKELIVPNGYRPRVIGVVMEGGGAFQANEQLKIVEGSPDGIMRCQKRENGCVGTELSPNSLFYFSKVREDTGTHIWAENKYTVTVAWEKTFLTYSSPFTGVGVPIIGTDYCIPQVGTLSRIEKDYDVAVGSDAGKTEVYGDDGSRSMGFLRGRGFSQLLGIYQPIANLGTHVFIQEGVEYAATCDQEHKRVYVYERVPAIGTGCYAVPGQTVVDGKYWGEVFCCADSYCTVAYGSTYACQDYKCVDGGTSTARCNTDADCQRPHFEDNSGQAYSVEGKCISGTCDWTFIKESCLPGKQYFDADGKELCCIATGFGYELGPCAAIPKACPTGMCCLQGNKVGYTIQLPPAGKECCDSDGDGVGYIDDVCVPDDGFSWGALQPLADLFGGGLMGGLIMIFVIFIFVIILIVILMAVVGGSN
jgi:hypothetical protein